MPGRVIQSGVYCKEARSSRTTLKRLARIFRSTAECVPCFNECAIDPHHHSLSRFGDNTGGDRFPRGSLLQCVYRQRAFGCVSWHNLDRRFPATAPPGAQQPDRKEVALRVRLADAGVQAYPLGQQFRHRRGNEPLSTMTAAIKTWGAHTEPPKHRIKTAAPIIL